MTEQEEKALVERLKSIVTPKGKLLLSAEEYEICIKYGISDDEIGRFDFGSVGKMFGNKVGIGKYAPGKGYCKIIDVKINYQVPDGRIFEYMLITKYSQNYTNHFTGDDVLINSRPLYNNASIGPKCDLKVGMILHVKEDTTVVNSSYRVVW